MLKWIKSSLLFVAALLVSFLALEVYLQTAEIQTPMETRIDPQIGPTFIAGKRVTRFNEGFYIGGINAYGYLGEPRPPRRGDNEARVLLLGDSYVMGMTVMPRHHFGRALEEELAALVGRPVAALNFGKADFNFSNLYQYHRDFAGTFDHDFSLFFVDQGDLVPARQFDRDLYPNLHVSPDGELRIDYSFRDSEKFRTYQQVEPVSRNSAFFRLAFNARKMVARGELGRVVLDKFAVLLPPKPRRPGPAPRPDVPAWTPVLLETLAADPTNVLVLKSEIDDDVRALVEQSGIRTIDLAPLLREMEAAGEDPFYWPVTGQRGHWNQEAHRRIGMHLAQALAPDLTRSGDRR